MWGHSGAELRLVMPWQFGVYREDRNSFDEQEAVCEKMGMWKELGKEPPVRKGRPQGRYY